ncbi:MAG: asparaginase [Planctomycetota bacterium]|nr:asparaginase [Planctomycetota bacterium]
MNRPESEPAIHPVLSAVTRSGRVESWHRGAVAVVHEGELVLSLGDVRAPVYARSAVKPMQALPLLERGVHRRLGLPYEELAVLCASHDGAAAHVGAVRSFLARGGLDEALLRCGPHAPFAKDARLALLRRGEHPLRVHNNCSGKHTGFLYLAQACGDDLEDYLQPHSAAQLEVNRAVAEMAGLDAPLPTGLDGCGAPTLLMSLEAMARAFCRFANHDRLSSVRSEACRTVFEAVGAAPALLAGEQRLCTALVRQWPGRAFAKNGAEGVYVMSLMPDPARDRLPGALGVAVKVDDGAERGYQPVVVDLLRWLGAFSSGEVPAPLQRFWRVPVANTQKQQVGEVRSVVDWGSL